MKSSLRHLLLGVSFAFLPFFALAQLSGSYTIGGSSANYSTISAAVSDLTSNGVSGPVVFTINAGSYSDYIYITSSISGASSTNNITFRGVGKYQVVISNSYPVYLYSTSYINVENVTLNGSTYGAYLYYANYCRIENCIIKSPSSSSSTYRSAYIYYSNYDTLRNNRIIGGYYSIYMYGSGTTYTSGYGNVIEGNDMVGAYLYGIYNYYGKQITITDNRVDSLTTANNIYLCYVYYGTETVIERNRFYYNNQYYYGIYMYYENYYGSSSSRSRIVNNFVGGKVSTYMYGIYLSTNSTRVDVLNNTVLSNGSSASGYLMYISSGSNHNVQNNNFYQASSSGYYAVYVSSASYVDTFDYNNIFSANSSYYAYFAGARSNLSALKSYSTSYNQNSYDASISYTDYRDHALEPVALNNKGNRWVGVDDDINGDPRPTSPDTDLDLGCKDYFLPANDAGISGFPAAAYCAGTATAQAIVKNYGTASLTSCDINWAISVDGGAYTAQTGTSLGSTLSPGSSTTVSLGNFSMASGKTYRIKAWTSSPNSSSDGKNSNDTNVVNMAPAMAGVYTVGGSGADYSTLGAAINDISAVGICGPITLRLAATSFNERVVIPTLSGASSTNTLRIVGQGKDNTTIAYSATSTSDIATVLLSGADYVTFDSLTIRANGASYGWALILTGQADHNTFSNCNLLTSIVSTSSNHGVVTISTSSTGPSSGNTSGNYNTFENCLLRGGYYGFYNYGGGSSAYTYGNSLINCDLYQHYYYPVYAYYGRDRYFVSNNIDSIRYSSGYGMMLGYGANDSIAGNYVRASGSYAVYGYYWNVYGNSTDTTYFVNNMVVGGSSYGLYGYSGYRCLFYGNSFYSSNSSGCVYYGSSMTSCEFKNNNFYNTSGYAGYWSSISGLVTGAFDYNNYYAPNSSSLVYFGGARTDLSALQSAYTSYNVNSISANPGYISTTNLHSLSTNINNLGLNMPRFAVDFDGDPRPTSPDTKFDIGADDYYLAPYDLDITAISPVVASSGLNTVSMTVKSNGLYTIASDTAWVSYSIDGGSNWVNDSLVISSLSPGSSMNFDFTVPINVSSGFTLCTKINGGIAGDPDADSMCQSVCIGSSGTYVIDINGNGDFTSFGAAISSLSGCGISGSVVFEVAPGTYNERIVVPEISGAGPNATISFVNPGNTNDVKIRYAASGSTDIATILLNGADYVRFENMVIRATGGSYGWAAILTGQADHNTFSNCNLLTSIVSTSSNHGVVTISTSSTGPSSGNTSGNYNTFENCLLRGGYYGFYNYGGGSSAYTYGNSLINCDLYQIYYYPVYAYYGRDRYLVSNNIDSIRNSSGYGMMLGYGNNDSIAGNYVRASGSYAVYGYYWNVYGNSTDTTYFVNNMIVGGSSYGLYGSLGYRNLFYGNSFYSSNSSGCVYYGSSMTSCEFKNNSFYNNSGYAGYWGSISGINAGAFDYNNYYAPNSSYLVYFDGDRTDLSALKSAYTSYNANSISVNPEYTSTTDLHSESVNLNNLGINMPRFAVDFDGDPRPTSPDTKFDIGADDYWLPEYDADIVGFSPTSLAAGSNSIGILIKNNGIKTWGSTDSIFVEYSIGGGSTVKDTVYPSSVAPDNTTLFTFTTPYTYTGSGTYVDACATFSRQFNNYDPDALDESYCQDMCVGGKNLVIVDASGQGDFSTIDSAVAYFNCVGLTAASTIRVKAGTYNEQVNLTQISGASSSNTLRIVGEGADQSIISYTSNGTGYYSTVRFAGADYVTIDSMGIEAKGSTYAWGVQMIDSANYNTISNCSISVPIGSSSSYWVPVVLSGSNNNPTSTGNNCSYNTFENNAISGGYYGVTLFGTAPYWRLTGNEFLNNTFTGHYYYGLYGYYTEGTLFKGNTMTDFTYDYGYALYFNYCTANTIEANKIMGSGYGLYMYYENYYASSNSSYIVNNMIGEYTYYGIYTDYYTFNPYILHNSVWSANGYYPLYAYYNYYPRIVNNVFVNTNGNYASYLYYGTRTNSDIAYNNYYAPNSYYTFYHDGSSYTDLSSYTASISGIAANSVERDPSFISTSDFHSYSDSINNIGDNTRSWATDFDGDARPTSPDTRVDMGADDYWIPLYDLDVLSVDSPSSIGIGSYPIVATFQNRGLRNLTGKTAWVSYQINGGTLVKDTIDCKFLKVGHDTTFTFTQNWNVSAEGSYSICVGVDTIISQTSDGRDEVCVSKCTGVADTLVVDPSGNGDFLTISEAIDKIGCGVLGPVVVYIKNGNYSESATLITPGGSSSVNNIQFIGESRTGVIWDNDGANATILFSNAAYYSFRDMSIINSHTATSNGVAVQMTDSSHHISFDNCDFRVSTATSNSSVAVLVTSAEDVGYYTGLRAATNIELSNCLLSGGYYGAFLIGRNTTDVDTNFVFEDCAFENQYYTALRVYQIGALTVHNSDFRDFRSTSPMAINMYYTQRSTLTQNRIVSKGYGIYANYDNYYGSGMDSSVYANNQIFQNNFNGNAYYGWYAYYCYYQRFYHNTLVTTTNSSSTTGAAIYLTGALYGTKVKNNNVFAANGGYLLYDGSFGTSAGDIDYNNYYSPVSFRVYQGAMWSSLASWQSGNTSYNQQSVSVNPYFNNLDSLEGLKAASAYLINAGTGLAIGTDWEGETRDALRPDIGADEIYKDFNLLKATGPGNQCRNLGDMDSVAIKIQNTGTVAFVEGDTLIVRYTAASVTQSDTLVVPTGLFFNPGDTVNHTFNEPMASGTPGANRPVIVGAYHRDNNALNDTFKHYFYTNPYPSAAFAVGDTCEYDASAFRNTSTVTIGNIATNGWLFGDGNTSSDESPAHGYGTYDTFSVRLVIATDSGCTDTAYGQAVTHPKPVASFSTANVCDGKTANFTNASSLAHGSLTYAWDMGDNTNTSTATNPSLTYGADGSYTVEMIANSDQGCSDTASQAITIYPTPAAAFTATEACQGDATEFTNGSTISNGSFSNRWEFGNGNTSTATNPTETYSAAGTYSVELLVGTSNGCADSLTKSVTVNPLPKSIFTANNMCYGDVMGLTNTSTGAGLSYKWYYGDGNTSTSQLPSYTYANPGTYTVSLVVTTNKGCTDSSSTSVTVANQPLAAFSVSNDCVHNGITFNNATSVACGAVSYYYWYYGDGSGDTLTSLSNPVHYYSAAGTYSVKLVIELSNSVRDSVTRTVTVYGQPTAAFTNTASCEGNLMQFTNTSSALTGTSLKSFAWTFGDGGSSALKNPTNTYSNSGGYNVRMIATDSRNCSDTVLTALTVSPNPAADFSYANACAYDALALTNKSTISSGTIAAYAWDFGNNTGSSSASPSVTYGTAGYYQVKMVATSSAGCKDSATKTVQAYASPSGGFSTSDVCLNEASSFTNQSSGATTYAWDFGNNSGTSTSTSPSYTYSGANTYTVSLVASNANGCRDTATGQATVNALPSASFSTADVCHGTAVSFSNGSSGASTYSWSYGDGQGSSLSSPSHTYSNAGTYDISLIAVTSKGCRDTADGSVTVNANPVVSISAGDECAYDEVSFANSTTGASSYAWTFGDGSGSSTAAPSHLYTNPGTYNAVLTATSSASCTTKDSLSVDVFAVPSASFTSKDACTGTANAFSNTSSISTGTMAHSWDFGDNSGTSNNTSPSYTYSIAGTYSVELISTSNNGCSDTATGTATVNALPSPDFTFSDVCLGSAMSFSNKSSGASSYSWSFGDGKTSTTTSPSNTYTVDGQYTVTLLATSSAGCTSSVSKTVTVYGLPTASFTATNECLGDAMTTTNLSSGASSYSWSFGDGNSSTSTAPSHTYGKSGSYTVNLTATSSNGCTSQKSASVTVYALPTASFSANTACQGSATTFSNSSNGASTYTWNFGDGTSSTLENPSRTYAADGTYKVTLTALSAEGCSDDVTVDVTVNEQPTAAFSASTECSGDTTAFTNLSTGTISTYAWNLGNGNSSSDANPSQVYTQGGSYTVELTVATSQGCSDKASQTVTVYSTPSAVFTTGNACLSDAASFDDNGSSGNGALLADREFTFGDGNNAFGRSATHTYAQHGDYTVSYKVTTVNGCSHTATTQITLYPMPALAVGAHDTCSGDALTFVNNSTIASGTMTYGWSFGEGSTSTDAAPTHTYDTMGTYTVSVAAISDMGCISDESFDVQVFPTPDALFVAGEVCVGDSARFQNHSEVAKGSISYEWSFGDGSVSSDEHPYHHYDTFGVFTVTMRVVSNKACANTYSLDYEVHEQPMAFLLLPPTCLGDSTKVPQAVLDAVRSDWSYRLTLGDGTVLTEVPSGYVYTHPGVYNAGLSIQTPFGCFDSASVDVTILPLPVMEDWAYTRLENQEISFGVTNADDSLEYAWDFGDGSVASGSSANHTFGGAGTYTVTCTATNGVGCSVVISKEVEVYPVGISEMAGAMHITAFPNPYTNWVKLDYTLDRNAYVRIEVLDMTGRRVAVVADGQQLAGNQALLLDEHHLPFAAGGAVVKVVVDNEVIFINLMKLR